MRQTMTVFLQFAKRPAPLCAHTDREGTARRATERSSHRDGQVLGSPDQDVGEGRSNPDRRAAGEEGQKR